MRHFLSEIQYNSWQFPDISGLHAVPNHNYEAKQQSGRISFKSTSPAIVRNRINTSSIATKTFFHAYETMSSVLSPTLLFPPRSLRLVFVRFVSYFLSASGFYPAARIRNFTSY